MKCPKCGAEDVHSAVRCGIHRAYICEKHCWEGCEYFFSNESSHVYCMFRDKLQERRKREEFERRSSEILVK